MIDSLGHGGSQRVLAWMANSWAQQGEDVSLITYLGGEDFFPLDRRVHRIKLITGQGQPSRARRLTANLDRLLKLRRALMSQRPDVVISFIHRTNVTTLLAAGRLGTPVVVSERTDPSQEELPKIWVKLRTWTYPKAAAVVVQTRPAARWFEETCPGIAVTVLPNPLPSVDESERWTPETAEPVVLGIGRLHPQKGFDVLIRAFALCIEEYSDWRLEILGEGEFRDELEELIASLGLTGKVSMPGPVRDVLRRLQRAGIFVLSSNVEGFPNALLEAMAVGVPSVSTSCRNGPSEIISHMRDGVLVPVGDPRSMAEAVGKLMSDSALRNSLASYTGDIADRLNPESIFREWEDLIRSCSKTDL